METKADQDVRRVLDHGVVVAGEVQVQLLGLKLLPVINRLDHACRVAGDELVDATPPGRVSSG